MKQDDIICNTQEQQQMAKLLHPPSKSSRNYMSWSAGERNILSQHHSIGQKNLTVNEPKALGINI
jgi:hypothetical protein